MYPSTSDICSAGPRDIEPGPSRTAIGYILSNFADWASEPIDGSSLFGSDRASVGDDRMEPRGARPEEGPTPSCTPLSQRLETNADMPIPGSLFVNAIPISQSRFFLKRPAVTEMAAGELTF